MPAANRLRNTGVCRFMKPLNVVYIHAHDLGRYCEPMGYPIPAPNLMRLAREGTLFRQAFAAAPSCAPSRAALVGCSGGRCAGNREFPH
ncbi:MAG: hypothetical protein D6820_13610 [Lentisphaerae bacterium]|nr:MAG: hypothetical protein D6820_13610 [Lentisphaerota bacterium]